MSNRVVLVTGATGGLGPAVVERFRTGGDTVVTVARKGAEITADLTHPEAAGDVIQQVSSRHGPPDVLVHLIGGFTVDGDITQTRDETWEQMIRVNLMSSVYLLRASVPAMRSRGTGRIIAIGSKNGVEPAAGVGAYAASKAALHALVQSAAEDLKGSGVTVNAVLPAIIRTAANASWATPEQAAKFVEPAAIAEAIFFLASDAAGEITGALVPVYGR
jgi:NAD(P)-dependent dehydrogenase (short-subunit alcohol dehydrogenase family)